MHRFALGLTLLLTGCGPSSQTTQQPPTKTLESAFVLPYDLTAPVETYALPTELREISGLTYYKAGQLLCVQDEEAVVYVFDLARKRIVKDFGFGGYGDFEGVEYVNGEVYVLESGGNLFRFAPGVDAPESTRISRMKTDLPKKTEVEGLGYEPKTKRLLIAVKEGSGPSSDKAVYSFDLLNRAVYKDIALNDEQLTGAGIDPRDYKPSGTAVHPITGDRYVLTSVGKRLLVTNRRASIRYSVSLNAGQFRQPEGICFAPNGDLFITNEAAGKQATLLRFAYKK